MPSSGLVLYLKRLVFQSEHFYAPYLPFISPILYQMTIIAQYQPFSALYLLFSGRSLGQKGLFLIRAFSCSIFAFLMAPSFIKRALLSNKSHFLFCICPPLAQFSNLHICLFNGPTSIKRGLLSNRSHFLFCTCPPLAQFSDKIDCFPSIGACFCCSLAFPLFHSLSK